MSDSGMGFDPRGDEPDDLGIDDMLADLTWDDLTEDGVITLD